MVDVHEVHACRMDLHERLARAGLRHGPGVRQFQHVRVAVDSDHDRFHNGSSFLSCINRLVDAGLPLLSIANFNKGDILGYTGLYY